MKLKNKKARMTPEEDACWTWAFEYYSNGGLRPLEADKCAWRDVCIHHPRLKKYKGALP